MMMKRMTRRGETLGKDMANEKRAAAAAAPAPAPALKEAASSCRGYRPYQVGGHLQACVNCACVVSGDSLLLCSAACGYVTPSQTTRPALPLCHSDEQEAVAQAPAAA
jgi:hypothetical protein